MTSANIRAGMALNRFRELDGAKIRSWFDAVIAFFSFLVFVAFLAFIASAVVVICSRSQLFKKSPAQIRVAVMRQANGASPSRQNWMLLTNTSQRRYRYALRPEGSADGSWHTAIVRKNESSLAGEMSPWTARLFSVSQPHGADAGSLTVVASRVLGSVETKVCRFFHCLKLDYPFGYDVEVTGIEF